MAMPCLGAPLEMGVICKELIYEDPRKLIRFQVGVAFFLGLVRSFSAGLQPVEDVGLQRRQDEDVSFGQTKLG